MKKNTRASNGSGTFRKRSDGRWEGRYTGPDGRQRSVYGPTQAAVKQAVKQAQAEMTLGLYFEPSKTTFEKWARTWLADYTSHIKPTTRDNYTAFMDRYLIPALGKVKLSQLRLVHIQRAFNAMADNGLSVGTQEAVKIALSSCLSAAVRFDMLKSNLCKDVKLAKKQAKDMVIIDRPDMPLFVLAAKKSPYYAAMMLLIQTGIRSGELRGLRWSDIDLDNRVMSIRQQVSDTKNGPIIQTTKGYKARDIILIPETVKVLREHKKAQAESRIKWGGWKDTDLTRDLVFRMEDGDVYPRCALAWPITKVGQEIGILGLHPHSLRDSYAVAALRSGIEVKTVQSNLGHKDATITLNTYAKYTDDMGRVGAEKFAAYWAENTKN